MTNSYHRPNKFYTIFLHTYSISLIGITVFATLLILISCAQNNDKKRSSIQTFFGLMLRQTYTSNIDSRIYTIELEEKTQHLTHISIAEQDIYWNRSQTNITQDFLEQYVVYKKDMLLFSSYEDASTARKDFLPYIGALIYDSEPSILRRNPSLHAPFIAEIPKNTSLTLVSPPFLVHKDSFFEQEATQIFSAPLTVWVKVRYPTVVEQTTPNT